MPIGLGDEQLWLCPSLDNATPFNDLSSQGNNGTAVGGLATIADSGAGGNLAYNIDTTSKYVDCGNILDAPAQFSISAWVNRGTRVDVTGIAGKWNGSGYMLYNSTPQVAIDGGPHTSGSTQIPASTWQHLAATYDGTTIRLYQDGVETSSQAHAAPSSTSATYQVGAYLSSGFRSLIDDVRQYDRPLTQSEITHLATARGIEGRPFDGLGDEQLWLCPSLENSPNDLSGNNNNGAYQGSMGTVADTGAGGSRAYDFDGSNDYINCGAGFNPATNLSLAAWVYADTWSGDPTGSRAIIEKGYDGTNEKFSLICRSNGSYLDLYTYISPDEHGIEGQVAPPSVANWHHVCGTFDGSTWRLFINGVQVATDADSTSLPSSNQDVSIGAIKFTGGPQRYFSGKMDDIRAYNRALTQAEISWLATERGVLGTPPEGLGDEQLWLCPSIQDSANDLSGNGNDGVIGSSVTTVADTSNGGTLAYNFPDTAGTNTITINDFDLGGLSQLTWSAWIYDESDNAASTHSSFFSWRKGGSGNDDILFFNYERSKLGFQLNNGADGGAFYTPVYYQNWKHYCVVFDGTNPTATDRLNLYVNGVLQTPDTTFSYPATTASPSGTPYAEIGDYVGSSNHGLFNFKGKQDDIRIYDRAITAAEITHLASQRGVLGAPALPTGLGDEQLWLCPSLENSPNDLSGNNNNGVYQNGMGTITDTAEGGSLAYDFDGVGDYIDCGNVLNITGPLSISFWVLNDTASKAMYVSKTWDGSTEGYISRLDSWASILRYYTYSGSFYGTSIANPFTLSQWSCVTNVYNGTHWEIYIDGARVAQTADTQAPFSNTGNLQFGNTTAAGGWNLDGRMDDIRIYNRALTQAEITHLASQRGVLGTPLVGLGTEKTWLCPSLLDAPTDITGNKTYTYGGGLATVANTDSGGSRAYDFDRTAAKGVFQDSGEVMDDTDSFAVSWWMNITTASNSINYYVLDCRQGGNGPGWGVHFRGGNTVYLGLGISRGSWHINAAAIPFGSHASFVNTPKFCTANWDNSTNTWSLYVDGVFTGSYVATVTGGSANPTGTHAAVGNYPVAPGTVYPPIGLIDDVRVHNRTLTQAEITHLATQRGVLGSPSTTTQYNAFVTHAFRQLFQTRLR